MSSLEIAELTGKQHGHVMRDIRNILEELGNPTQSNFGSSYRDSTGRTLPCYALPKRETMILVSGYSISLRARIVDRWQELEAQVSGLKPQLPDFTNPVIAARAWADEFEGRLFSHVLSLRICRGREDDAGEKLTNRLRSPVTGVPMPVGCRVRGSADRRLRAPLAIYRRGS